MSFVRVERLLARGAALGRECGPCSACCTLLPIVELRKPARRACEHVRRDGCGIHPERPESCRAFHCAWLRGALSNDEALRPDALGILLDHFVLTDTNTEHTVALEVWAGALERPEVREVLDELSLTREVQCVARDGSAGPWRSE